MSVNLPRNQGSLRGFGFIYYDDTDAGEASAAKVLVSTVLNLWQMILRDKSNSNLGSQVSQVYIFLHLSGYYILEQCGDQRSAYSMQLRQETQ